jgi:hypothetical protein
MGKIEKFLEETGFDREFLEWFFSAQTEKELEDALRAREKYKEYWRRYKQRYPEKVKEMNKRRYEKLKQDPERYQRHLVRQRIYYRLRMIKIKRDPVEYQKYLERNRVYSKKHYLKKKIKKLQEAMKNEGNAII